MKLTGRPRSLQGRLVTNYIIISLVVISFAMLGMFRLLWGFTFESFDTSNQQKTEQLQRNVDAQLLWMENMGQRMANESALSTEAVVADRTGIATLNAATGFRYTLSLLEDFVICYWDDRICCVPTPNCLYNIKYFDAMYAYTGLTIVDMRRKMTELGGPQYYNPTPDSVAPGYIIYARPLLSSMEHAQSMAFFIIDVREIVSVTQKLFSQELVSFSLLTRDGNALYAETFGPDTGRAFKTYTFPSENQNFLLLSISVAQPAFLGRIGIAQKMVLGVSGAMIVAGILLSVLMARRVSRPIRSLQARMADGQHVSADSQPYAELAAIEQTWQKMVTEKGELASLVDTQSAILQTNLLQLLLHGKLEDIAPQSLREALGLSQEHTRLVLVYMLLDRRNLYAATYDAVAQAALEEDILGAFEGLRKPNLSMTFPRFTPGKTALLLLACTPDTPREALLADCRAAQSRVTECTEQTVTLVVGEGFEDLSEVREQYENLQSAAQYRILTGWNSFLDVACLPNLEPREKQPLDLSAIQNACAIPDPREALLALDGIFGQLGIRPDMIAFKHAYFKLVSMLRGMTEQLIGQDPPLPDMDFEPETRDEACEQVARFVLRICDEVREEKLRRHSGVCASAMEYMREHYADNLLDLRAVAEYFHISPGYLNRSFKEQYGQSISAALDALRMEHAKRLLVESRMLIKDVIAASGYGDVNNFIRKFKQQEGVTPLVYRKAHASLHDTDAPS